LAACVLPHAACLVKPSALKISAHTDALGERLAIGGFGGAEGAQFRAKFSFGKRAKAEPGVVRRVPGHIAEGAQGYGRVARGSSPGTNGRDQLGAKAAAAMVGVNVELVEVGGVINQIDNGKRHRRIGGIGGDPEPAGGLCGFEFGKRQGRHVGDECVRRATEGLRRRKLDSVEVCEIIGAGGANDIHSLQFLMTTDERGSTLAGRLSSVVRRL
jgi:hypothetical protein